MSSKEGNMDLFHWFFPSCTQDVGNMVDSALRMQLHIMLPFNNEHCKTYCRVLPSITSPSNERHWHAAFLNYIFLKLKISVVWRSYVTHAYMVLTHKVLPYIWQHNVLHFILCLYLVYVREAYFRLNLTGDILCVCDYIPLQ